MTDSIRRPVATTSSPRRDLASASALAAGMNSALQDHGRAPGRGDQDVGPKSGVVDDDLGVLGAHDASGQRIREQLAEGGC